jgi:hypothetical protein
MTRILLGSGCNEPYYPRMLPYLRSVQEHNTFAEQFLVGVGWAPPAEHGFQPVELPMKLARGRNRVFCVQHGVFLKAMTLSPDDIVIYTDGGDVVMQRDFSEDERRLIESIDEQTVLVGWNEGPSDTLETEGQRLQPIGSRWRRLWRKELHLPIYNTGVLIARASGYEQLYRRIERSFNHYANIQWGICWVLGTHPELRVQVLPHSIHTHGHYPLPPGARAEGETLFFEDELVVFRHNYPTRDNSLWSPERGWPAGQVSE